MNKKYALDFLLDRAVKHAVDELVRDGLITINEEAGTWILTKKGWEEYKKYVGKGVGKEN